VHLQILQRFYSGEKSVMNMCDGVQSQMSVNETHQLLGKVIIHNGLALHWRIPMGIPANTRTTIIASLFFSEGSECDVLHLQSSKICQISKHFAI